MTHFAPAIRVGCAADIVHIMSVMRSAFAEDFGEAWSESQVSNTLLIPNHGSLIWQQDGADYAQAFLLWRWVAEESEMLMLGVDPGWRGQSIATYLMQAWQNLAKANGVTELFLEVRANNRAISLYEKQGFTKVGCRPFYYKSKNGEAFDAHTMRKYC
jgi:[ribosomal protein S18]-alanine N-acetyltransferase